MVSPLLSWQFVKDRDQLCNNRTVTLEDNIENEKLTHNFNPHVGCQGLLFFILSQKNKEVM